VNKFILWLYYAYALINYMSGNCDKLLLDLALYDIGVGSRPWTYLSVLNICIYIYISLR
jgi:hypothetical protein